MIRAISSQIKVRWHSRLGRESFYSLLCGVIYALSQWLLLKLLFVYLGTETGGWYAYAMAVITPILSFGSFGLRAILVTDAKSEYAFAEYLSFRIIAIAVMVAAAIAGYEFVTPPKDPTTRWTLAFVFLALYRGVEWISDLAQGEYQRQGRMRVVVGTFLSKLVLGVGAFAAAIRFWHSLTLGFFAMGVVTCAVLAGYELRFHRLKCSVLPVFHAHGLKKIAILSAPVGAILLLVALQNSIPRFFLERYESLKTLGVFGGLSYLGVFGGFLSTAIGNAMAPILSQYWAQRSLLQFRRLLLGVLLIDGIVALGMAIAFVLFGRPMLAALFNREVAEYSSYLPLVAAIGLANFWDSHLGCALAVLRRFKTQMAIQATRVIVLTPIALALVREGSLAGALIACAVFPLASLIPFSAIVWAEYRRTSKAGSMIASEAIGTATHSGMPAPTGTGDA